MPMTPKRNILIIVENLPLPFDRRVWQEAGALRNAGYGISIICPTGKGYEKRFEIIDDIAIYRHPLPLEADGAPGYLIEYGSALFWEWALSLRVYKERGFDAIQACNPPDTIFLVALFWKWLFGVKFVFDHHDINPELYIAKFGRKDLFYKLMLLLERLTFMTADRSIATNASYREIAIRRGSMRPDRVTIVRSGPDLKRLNPVPPNPELKNGRRFLVGYVGVMGKQEGIDHLLEAARIIVYDHQRRDIQFTLIGAGTELEELKALSRRLGLDNFVNFTGRIPDAPMVEILCTADICVNPDIANEMNDKSTMNKIMEYMALGRPIVQYDLTEGRFSAQDASLYANRNDSADLAAKIMALLDDPERREWMGACGACRVQEELHWGVESKNFLRVYAKLFG